MSTIISLLGRVTQSLPHGGEERPGQAKMAELVAKAVTGNEALLVEAGTGTGKSLAYLTPAVAAESRTVVATATIALQSQLVDIDVPMIAESLEKDISVALLKGRRNYLCLQRLQELKRAKASEQLELLGGQNLQEDLTEISDWADETVIGDRDELNPAPSPSMWAAVSVGADECPGAARCPVGAECFSEKARQKAAIADVIVTNHHYYGLNLASGGALLPEHDVVIFDEAHQLPEVLGATCGTEVSGGRFRSLSRRVRNVLTEESLSLDLDVAGGDLDAALRPLLGTAIEKSLEMVDALIKGRDKADRALGALRKLKPSEGSDIGARIERATLAATRLINDIDTVLGVADSDVLWVDGNSNAPNLKRTPLELGELLERELWDDRAVILTSATLSDGILSQLGLDASTEIERVGSPFDYESQGLLYCPTDLPSPKSPEFRVGVQDEMISLINAAGGRTLGLFTSYGAMTEAAERLSEELDTPVLVQGEAAKPVLIEKFKADPRTTLLATMSFWQGIDLPGDTLTLVTIDRLPFPRPDEPVAKAKRDRAGASAFRVVDLPRAQTLLAQAAGRLIRRSSDRGVVAVLDSRLATNRAYRWDLISALPPFRRTKDRAEVQAFLAELNNDANNDQ